MNVGVLDNTGNKNYILNIGELEINKDESSKIKYLIDYNIIEDKFSYYERLLVGDGIVLEDDILIYWIEHVSTHGDEIEFVYKNSYYATNWSYINRYPYEGFVYIAKGEQLTINKVMSKDDKLKDDIDIGDIGLRITKYLISDIKELYNDNIQSIILHKK